MQITPTNSHSADASSWLVSLAFWLTLFSSATIFGGVALAPKLLTLLTLQNDYSARQSKLMQLERQVQHLGKVAKALEDDPEFAAELARVDLDAARPGDERIPVQPEHRLDAAADSAVSTAVPELPWYTPAVRWLATSGRTRAVLLTVAAMMALAAFTVLHEAHLPRLQAATATVRCGLRRLADRYRKA